MLSYWTCIRKVRCKSLKPTYIIIEIRSTKGHLNWYITLFFCKNPVINQMKKYFKTLIRRNILPTDPNKKIKLIIIHLKLPTWSLKIIPLLPLGFCKQKLQILEALHIRNMQPKLNRINFKTSANVLKCL